MTTLGPICSFLNGGTPSRGVPRYYQGDVPWITGADISGPRADTARRFITEEAIRESATNRVPAGTVLLVTRTSVGKVALAAMELCFSQDITAITPDPHCLDRSYLVHFLRTKQPHLERLARGATIKGVTRKAVANLAIPLPPLDQQKRIAGILDAADALRAKRREAIAQLDTLLQSTLLDMFGDPVTNPKGLDVELLGELIAMGPQNGLYKPERNYGSGVRILRINGFYGGVVNDPSTLKRVNVSEQDIEKYGLSESDIVINRVNSRSHLGKSALIRDLGGEPIIFESNMMRLAVDSTRVSPLFMIHFLQTDFIRNQILRSAKDSINQASINQGDVKGLRILVI